MYLYWGTMLNIIRVKLFKLRLQGQCEEIRITTSSLVSVTLNTSEEYLLKVPIKVPFFFVSSSVVLCQSFTCVVQINTWIRLQDSRSPRIMIIGSSKFPRVFHSSTHAVTTAIFNGFVPVLNELFFNSCTYALAKPIWLPLHCAWLW